MGREACLAVSSRPLDQRQNVTESSHCSVVKVMDLSPAHLGSNPAGTHMSQGWRQEGHLAKTAPVHIHQYKSYLGKARLSLE